MKILKFSISFIILLLITLSAHSQEKIIFDTDFGGDADDLGALAMLHHFIDEGECDLLAIMCWSVEEYAVSAIDAVNRYYNHPEIPIGTRKDSVEYVKWCYSKPITDQFSFDKTHKSVLESTILYRKILAESTDSSIIILTVGPLKNIENLMNSTPDSISDLSGMELIRLKVKKFVMMGGQFPAGKWEWNFSGSMLGVTQNVLSRLTTPIVFSGFEVGVGIKTGEVFNELDTNSPLYIGFLHFSNHAPWMEKYYNGKIVNNASFDQTAVLYAVKNGAGLYWSLNNGSLCIPDERGGNVWAKNANSNHSYLKLLVSEEDMSKLIDNMMLGKNEK